MYAKIRLLLVFVCCFSLTSCTFVIFPARALISPTNLNLDAIDNPLAIAIEPNGRKNIVWLEGDSLEKYLVFYRTMFGEQQLRKQLLDNGAHVPDIAVTDDGNAYVVWFSDSTSFHYCLSVIPPSGLSSFTCTNLYDGDLPPGIVMIRVIARDNYVYVVYPTYKGIYYKQLTYRFNTEGWV
ncbi:MAG: hypothetical protein ACPL6F_00125, partial [Anaerolineales bacterium]